MKNFTCSRARRGFTLIEMLVVIGIIALLAAILFPVFGRVREGGRRTACSSNLQQLGLSFRQYLQDDGGRYPGAGQYQKWGNGGHWVSGVNDTDAGTASKLAKLDDPGKGEPIANAASATGFNAANVEAGALYPYVKEAKVYYCPSNPSGAQKRLSYSMNCAIAGMGEVRIKEPSSIILLVDEEKANDGYLYTAGKLTGGGTSTDELTQRHNTSGNLLFVDGHVKAYPFAAFPMTPDNSSLKVDTTPGKIRFQDKAFGPDGYFAPGVITPAPVPAPVPAAPAPVFGTCFAPQ